MNLKLKRNLKSQDGIFGELLDDKGNKILSTLEHAYLLVNSYEAKIPDGNYRCVRGEHQLHNGLVFNTFEVITPSHKGILFHSGNFNKDSEGCILLGLRKEGTSVVESKRAFADFMSLQDGVQEFMLGVS